MHLVYAGVVMTCNSECVHMVMHLLFCFCLWFPFVALCSNISLTSASNNSVTFLPVLALQQNENCVSQVCSSWEGKCGCPLITSHHITHQPSSTIHLQICNVKRIVTKVIISSDHHLVSRKGMPRAAAHAALSLKLTCLSSSRSHLFLLTAWEITCNINFHRYSVITQQEQMEKCLCPSACAFGL